MNKSFETGTLLLRVVTGIIFLFTVYPSFKGWKELRNFSRASGFRPLWSMSSRRLSLSAGF